MRVRAITQAQLARRLNMHSGNVNRVVIGQVSLTPRNRPFFAEALGCTEVDLVRNIGDPISEEGEDEHLHPPVTWLDRLKVVALALGMASPFDLADWIATGNYGRLPPRLATRFRILLEKMLRPR